MRSTSPTEVPPYFWTISATVRYSLQGRVCSRARLSPMAARPLRATSGMSTGARRAFDGEARVGVPSGAAHDPPAIAHRRRHPEPGGDPRGGPRRRHVELAPEAAGAGASVPRAGGPGRRGRRARLRHQHRLRHAGRGAHRQEGPARAAAQPDPLARRRRRRARCRCPRRARCCCCAATCSPRATPASARRRSQLALEMLNRDVVPVVPERGSVGASGDLAPLAHLALVLIGEGEAFFEGQRLPGARRRWSAPGSSRWCSRPRRASRWSTAPRRCARWARSLQLRAEALAELADVAGAMTLEGLLGSHKPFIARDPRRAPAPGPAAVRRAPAPLLAGQRAGRDATSNCAKVQDPYSLRCMPQVHGAARDGLALRPARSSRSRSTAPPTTRWSSSTTERIVSGGNFHGQPVSLALDVLAMALHPARVDQRAARGAAGEPVAVAGCRRSWRRTRASTRAS